MIVVPMMFSEVREQGASLLAEYALECRIPELGEPAPQWELYEVLQASGRLKVFGAYVDGALVGFGAVLLSLLPHYGVMAGMVESLFVGAAYRKTLAGVRLMHALEACAGLAGCRAILYSAPCGGMLEKVLDGRYRRGKRRRPYRRTNSVFCKALG